MWDKLLPVWLVTRRELRDQMRDWRVLTPLIILTVFFPILMNEFSRMTVDFLNQFNADLILDRLVPFSILIIGFFPITVSLVVSLESFVGEKERGTIEPLLSSPLENWQLYFGKLLLGIFTPLIASYLSILFYLVMVGRQGLELPPWHIIIQLLILTTAHAVLMVSAAIVISVQSTSVKAANLLASFIVIPVAVLMQGEAVLLFWGNEEVLWLAVVAVTILALLIIRVGIAHFQREYLLGREIDAINLRWIGSTFWRYLKGDAKSIFQWYGSSVGPSLRKLTTPTMLIALLAVLGIWLGYDWIMQNMPTALERTSPENLQRLMDRAQTTPDMRAFRDSISAPFLFMNNTRAMVMILLAGLVSFSVLGIVLYILNISLLGGVFGVLQLLGASPLLFWSGVLPHGIFEVPALMIGSAAVLYIGVALVTPQTGRSMGEVLIELIADWVKVFIGIVVPLLAIAALIEAYITPVILLATLKG
ncbi:MAG: stage II sporulation protein M [Chloroflexota bacterium]